MNMDEDMDGRLASESENDNKDEKQTPQNAMDMLRSAQEEMIKKTLTEGTFDDLIGSVKETDETVVTWQDKYYTVVFKWMGWGAQNQLKERLVRTLRKPTPMEYKRKYQEEMMRKMVISIAGMQMQDKHGNVMEANWAKIPAPVGEYMRQFFFGETGEIANAIEDGTGMDLNDIIEMLNRLKEEDNGIVTELESKIKKLAGRSRHS